MHTRVAEQCAQDMDRISEITNQCRRLNTEARRLRVAKLSEMTPEERDATLAAMSNQERNQVLKDMTEKDRAAALHIPMDQDARKMMAAAMHEGYAGVATIENKKERAVELKRVKTEGSKRRNFICEGIPEEVHGVVPGASQRPVWAQQAIEQHVKPAGHFFVSMCDLLGGLSTLAVLTVLLPL